MPERRKRHTAEFKAKVAVKAVAELSSEFQWHPVQISQWKRRAVEGLSGLFQGPSRRAEPALEAVTAPLYEQFGRLKAELDWLKKPNGSIEDKRMWIEPHHPAIRCR